MIDDRERRLRCLVVGNGYEHGTPLAQNLSEMLESIGHTSHVVTGQDAIVICAFSRDHYDLVLIDGHEQVAVARAVKDAAAARGQLGGSASATRVILATGSPALWSARPGDRGYDGSLRDIGVDVVLHKPFSSEDLERVLADFDAKPG